MTSNDLFSYTQLVLNVCKLLTKTENDMFYFSVCQDPQQLTITEMFQRSFDEDDEMLALIDEDQ